MATYAEAFVFFREDEVLAHTRNDVITDITAKTVVVFPNGRRVYAPADIPVEQVGGLVLCIKDQLGEMAFPESFPAFGLQQSVRWAYQSIHQMLRHYRRWFSAELEQRELPERAIHLARWRDLATGKR